MALFPHLIHWNDGRKTHRFFPLDLNFKPKRIEKENKPRLHALVPMHKKQG
jgi:hypothetical protein